MKDVLVFFILCLTIVSLLLIGKCDNDNPDYKMTYECSSVRAGGEGGGEPRRRGAAHPEAGGCADQTLPPWTSPEGRLARVMG